MLGSKRQGQRNDPLMIISKENVVALSEPTTAAKTFINEIPIKPN